MNKAILNLKDYNGCQLMLLIRTAQLSPAEMPSPQNSEMQYSSPYSKPLSLQVVCYTEMDKWNTHPPPAFLRHQKRLGSGSDWLMRADYEILRNLVSQLLNKAIIKNYSSYNEVNYILKSE